jgi:hypothetical protein
MKLWDLIKESTMMGGKPSSSRIIGYFVSINIALSGFSFVVIDVVNAIQAWRTSGHYEIPGTHVALFGMMLAHQLSLLGIYKALEKPAVIPAIAPPVETKVDTPTENQP